MITLEQAKLWLRVDTDADDADITDAIEAVKADFETDTNLTFGTQLSENNKQIERALLHALSVALGEDNDGKSKKYYETAVRRFKNWTVC